jgi:hypothetical protein
MEHVDIDMGFALDAELPPFQFECARNLFGSIEEPIERLEAIVTWVGGSDMRAEHVRIWISAWNVNCSTYMAAIIYDEWFYLYEPKQMNRRAWNEDRFAVRGTECWVCRTAQLKTVVSFMMTCTRYDKELNNLNEWIRAGKRAAKY